MSTDQHDKLYSILLDVQKQLGVVSRETGEQTKKLDALNDKVAVANGRTSKNEVAISNNQESIAKLRNKSWYIMGAFAVISVIGLYAATQYIKEVAGKTAQEVLTNLEEKYQIEIQ